MEQPESLTLLMRSIREPLVPARLSIDQEALGSLADDIAANGLLQPIGVAGPDPDGFHEIGFGHRRYLAHKLLQRASIDVRRWPAGTPLDDVRSAENYQREALSPIEEANDVGRRLERGESRAAIARILRRSAAWVGQRERLLTLPDELQSAVHHGELSIGIAIELAAIDHEPYRRSLIDEAQQHGASLMTVRVWCAHYQRDKVRIVNNEMAVQEIVEARSTFVPYYSCECCRLEVPYTATRSWRFCSNCGAQVEAAMRAQV
jgi:ParB/RepB/Spo0J family partition protein